MRESKTVLDSGFHAVDSRVQLLDSRSFSVELRFRIPIVSGILDFYGGIPDSIRNPIPLYGEKDTHGAHVYGPTVH